MEFLGLQLDRTGYKPLPSHVDAILRIQLPSNLKQVHSFLGVINFIKNHIPNRMVSWGEEQQLAFYKIKAIVAESIMLTYPNLNWPFDIYPDASSTYMMGALLVQDGNVVSTFSCKFNNVQLKYTVTGQELLAAVEACKHSEQMIHGCKIRIHTNHQNLMHSNTMHANL
jgi:hypothetical protein